MLNSVDKVRHGTEALRGRLGATSLLLLVLAAAPSFAWAAASAIAYGSDGSWEWATRNTQREANKVALRGCNERAPKKDCVLDSTKAVVRAEDGGRIGFGRSSVSLAEARKLALDSCGKAECKVTFEMAKPGFYSLFKAEEDKNGNSNFFLAHEYTDSDKADKEAYEGCKNLTGRNCKIVWSGAIAGVYKLATARAPNPSPISSERNCRPNTPTVRCSSQCTNGNCIVTYENGCKIRVQVQPRFDGFTNQWTYPSPDC